MNYIYYFELNSLLIIFNIEFHPKGYNENI